MEERVIVDSSLASASATTYIRVGSLRAMFAKPRDYVERASSELAQRASADEREGLQKTSVERRK
jgi:hypothetical protein